MFKLTSVGAARERIKISARRAIRASGLRPREISNLTMPELLSLCAKQRARNRRKIMLKKKKTADKRWKLLTERVIGDDNLLRQILLCVNIKSLPKSQLVCRRWKNLIRDESFQEDRNIRVDKPSGMLMRYRDYKTGFVPFEGGYVSRVRRIRYEFDIVTVSVAQSCNGLVLCFAYNIQPGTPHFYWRLFQSRRVFVFNPTTDRIATISLPEGDIRSILQVTLAFDPSRSEGYKLVLVNRVPESSNVKIRVYSSSTEIWNDDIVPVPISNPTDVTFGFAAFCNGAVFWASSTSSPGLYFRIEEQTFHEFPMPLPPTPYITRVCSFYFGATNNCLVTTVSNLDRRREEIYRMGGNFDSWELLHAVDFESPSRWIPIYVMIQQGDDYGVFIRGNNLEELIRYHFTTGRITILSSTRKMTREIKLNGGGRLEAGIPYIESLAPV